jgi:O-antigen/teichoic acid export membrane protein
VGTLSALYLALVITALLRLLVRAAIVTRLLRLPSLRPDTSLMALVVGDAGWGWLQGAGSLAFGLADRFIIGSMIGATALAHYSVASQLAQPIHAFPAAGTSVIFPKISAAVARGDTDRLRQLLRTALLLLVLAVTTAGGLLLVLRTVILSAWLGPDTAAAAAPTLGLLCVAFWLLALIVLPHYVLLGLGRFRFVALTNLAAGVVTVVVMVWAAGRYGIEGVAAARIVYGVILMANFVPLVPLWKSHGTHTAQS